MARQPSPHLASQQSGSPQPGRLAQALLAVPTTGPLPTLNGREDRSTLVTVSENIWVPNRALCWRNRSVISAPRMPCSQEARGRR